MNDGIWRGVDKPGGARFYTKPPLAHEKDCPKCKFGTLMKMPFRKKRKPHVMRCIDCGHEIPIEKP